MLWCLVESVPAARVGLLPQSVDLVVRSRQLSAQAPVFQRARHGLDETLFVTGFSDAILGLQLGVFRVGPFVHLAVAQVEACVTRDLDDAILERAKEPVLLKESLCQAHLSAVFPEQAPLLSILRAGGELEAKRRHAFDIGTYF